MPLGFAVTNVCSTLILAQVEHLVRLKCVLGFSRVFVFSQQRLRGLLELKQTSLAFTNLDFE